MRRDATSRSHALLRRLLPERLRRAHGSEMERVFRERLREQRAKRGVAGVAATWVREAWDLAGTSARFGMSNLGRGGGGMGGWMDDFRSAARSLRRSPGFAAFAVGTLALGIGATIGFAAFLDRIVLRPVDFPDGDRVVMVWKSRKTGGLMLSPDQEMAARARSADVFEGVAATSGRDVAWSTDEGPRMLAARFMDTSLPTLAGLPPTAGRFFDQDDLAGTGAPVVILSEGLWKRAFGADPEVIGTSVRLDGTPRTVIGVAPEKLRAPGPGNASVEVWLPLPGDGSQPGLSVFARLKDDVTLDQANERMKSLDLVAAEAEASPWETKLVPVAEMATARLRSPLKVVGVGVALLLLIACINVANLLLARGDARMRDTAVRAAVGAGRFRLGREMVFEALAISLGASMLGLVLAAGALEVVRSTTPENLTLLETLHLDPVVTVASVGCAIVTVLLFGLLPLLRRVRIQPGSVLTERSGTSGSDSVGLRRLLLVGEVALSFALLTTAAQIVSALAEVRRRDPGFAMDELLAVELSLPEWRFPDEVARQVALDGITASLARQPGVQAVTVAGGAPPRTGIFFGEAEAEGQPSPDGEGTNAIFFGNSVAPGYFEAVGLEVVEGRGFVPGDLDGDQPAVVLGESAVAKYFPDGQALGGRFRIGDQTWLTVVGVVRDIWVTGSVNESDYPQLYMLAEKGQGGAVLVRSADPASVASLVRPLVRGVDVEIPVVDVRPVALGYSEALSRERLVAWLLTGFAVTAGLLAAVGLYGVVTQIALRRTREFGIRISLGAEPSGVFRLALRAGATSVVLGLMAGGGLAWAGLKFMKMGIAGLDAVDPLAFLMAAALLAVSTLAAMSVPAARAARTNPSDALRAE